MDAFEEIITALFEQEGYWTLRNCMVDLSKEQKRELKNPSMPRPEIDIVAYKPRNNELVLIECKSYLDSAGVRLISVMPDVESGRKIKLFADSLYRQRVTEEFVKQAKVSGLLLSDPSVQYCLVAGNIYPLDRESLRDHFQKQGWLLYDPEWIKDQLNNIAKIGYKNSLAVMMAKLLLN